MSLSHFSQQIVSLIGDKLYCKSIEDEVNTVLLSHFEFCPHSVTSNDFGILCYNENKLAYKAKNKMHRTIDIKNIVKCLFHPLDPLLIIVLQENGLTLIKNNAVVDHFRFKSMKDPDDVPIEMCINKHLIMIVRRNGSIQCWPYLPESCIVNLNDYEFIKEFIDIDKYKISIQKGVTISRTSVAICVPFDISISNSKSDTTSAVFNLVDNKTWALYRAHSDGTIGLFLIQNKIATQIELIYLFNEEQDYSPVLIKDPMFNDVVYCKCTSLFALYSPCLNHLEIDATSHPSLLLLISPLIDDITVFNKYLITTLNGTITTLTKPPYLSTLESNLSEPSHCILNEPFFAYETLSRLTQCSDMPPEIEWKNLESSKDTVLRLHTVTTTMREEMSILKSCTEDVEKRKVMQKTVQKQQQRIVKENQDKSVLVGEQQIDLENRLHSLIKHHDALLKKTNKLILSFVLLNKNCKFDFTTIEAKKKDISDVQDVFQSVLYKFNVHHPVVDSSQEERWQKYLESIQEEILHFKVKTDIHQKDIMEMEDHYRELYREQLK